MQNNYYKVHVKNPNFETLGYISAVANLDDKHDRSAPSNHHWKILKCRMIIFSNSSILASPDKNEIKQVHIIFNKVGDDYDKLNSLFQKYSLLQNGTIRKPTVDMFKICFDYTMTAKLAPVWNTIANNYLINNRDFLTTCGPQEGVKYLVESEEKYTILQIKPVKINLIRIDEDFLPGEWIRIFPSLNKATIDSCFETLPTNGSFRSYKDLRRHWKNIHGYRLPEQEGSYCAVQFWRGEPLTYPKICVIRNFPIITPITNSDEQKVLARFINCLKSKMPHFLGEPIKIGLFENTKVNTLTQQSANIPDTQGVSLCTPTQYQNQKF